MGNYFIKDEDNDKRPRCLICYSSTTNEGRYCDKCYQVIVHIKDHSDDGIQNTQMILDRLSMGSIEFVKNNGNNKCAECNFIPISIFFNNRCFSCGIDKRLDEISEDVDIKLRSTRCYRELDLGKVKYDERKKGYGDVMAETFSFMT